MGVKDFVTLFMVFLLIIWHASGVPPQDTSLVKGAAAFLTVPIDILHPLVGGSILLMAALFFILVKYLGLLEGFLGESVTGFIVIAAVILILTGAWQF